MCYCFIGKMGWISTLVGKTQTYKLGPLADREHETFIFIDPDKLTNDYFYKKRRSSSVLDTPPNKRKKEVSAGVPKLHGASTKFEKCEESQELIRKAFMGNEFLKNLDQFQIEAIVEAMYSKEYEADQNIVTEGEIGSHLYVSAEGEFVVYVDNKEINGFGPGVAFGEVAILYNTKRNATIKVLTHARVWVLKRQIFQQIMMGTGLKSIDDKVTFLRRNPLLKDLSKNILAKMSDLLQVEFFEPGHCIIRQGDKGDKFYIISGGSVRITKKEPGSDTEKELGIFSHGKYFGELALLKEDTRQATVTAMAPGVECLVLDRIPFIQLLGDLDEIKNNAELLTSRNETESWDNAEHKSKIKYAYIELSDLNYVGTLGVGGFGRVELMEYKKNNNLTFALKYLKKSYIVQQQQEEHVYNEKGVMMACSDCPFISKLYRTYRDNKYVYFLMEACLGGDVFTALQKYKKFTEGTARFMTGCVVEALEFLHEQGFIYRDLKPENLLLDEEGYVKMVDFGFAKRVGHTGKTWTFAGTPEYLAPEIILNKGHDRAADYWTLGVFIHELITGRPPFRGKDHLETYNLIVKGISNVRLKGISSEAKDLIRRLCRSAPTERIGYQKTGIQDIKNHKWFQGFNWEALRNRRIKAPVIPSINGPTDLRNFDKLHRSQSDPADETSGWDKDF